MEIKAMQEIVDQWIKRVGVRYFNELTNMAMLCEETGEVARIISRLYGEQSFKTTTSDAEAKVMLADEMADVLFVLICLANQTGIDLENAFVKNMNKKTQRDHNRHQDNPKLKA